MKNMSYSNLSNEELEQLVGQGNGDAICELGERCLQAKNYTRAYQLFHKGEKQGLQRAYIGLGEMYKEGKYFMRDEQLAREYYAKAGVPYPGSGTNQTQNFTNYSNSNVYGNAQNRGDFRQCNSGQFKNTLSIITDASLRIKLQQVESMRVADEYSNARALCEEVVKSIESINSGFVQYSGQSDIDDILIDAYWSLAYISFNEQKYQEMENYLAKQNVLGAHPWGTYLSAISHKIMQAPPVIMEQDFQMLTTVSNNQNLSTQERGDICTIIADLIQEGYGKNSGANADMARNYYQEAANCGNAYAAEQLNGMF